MLATLNQDLGVQYRTNKHLPNLFKHRKPGPLGQVRVNWLCRRQMPWNDGILEWWNNGFKRMRSFFDKLGQSEIKIKIISAFHTQYSNIPPFHWTYKINSAPLG
jgi:hypothetical protein